MVETITSVTIENWAMMNCKMSLKDGKEIDIDYSENSENESQENEDGGFFDGEEGLSDVDIG